MRTRFIAISLVVASLMVSGQALAQVPTFQAGQVLTSEELNHIVEQLNENTNALEAHIESSEDLAALDKEIELDLGGLGCLLTEENPRAIILGRRCHRVDCPSQTIAAAMYEAQPGDAIEIAGTCHETVVVDKDGITLRGGGSAVIDAGGTGHVITVIGHQNVTIKGLSARDGTSGIDIANNSYVNLIDVSITNNEGSGIVVSSNSSVFVTGCLIEGNGREGIEVIRNSTLFIRDTVVRSNDSNGIRVANNSYVESDSGPAISITSNRRNGILLFDGASANLPAAFITGNWNNDAVVSFMSRLYYIPIEPTTSDMFCDVTSLIEGITCPHY